MAVASFTELLEHVGHEVEVVAYQYPTPPGPEGCANVAVECQTCGEVLFDYDADDEEGEE